MKKITILILFALNCFGQSTSVFDANIFNVGNKKPPFLIGEGFLINDPFKQTLQCFTDASISEKNLVSLDNNSKKTETKIFYFQTESQYNDYKLKGYSGKIGFFSLFSFEKEYFEDAKSESFSNSEVLIISLKNDFGVFKYKNNPILEAEAKKLISDKDYSSFIDKYGSHFINGFRKESSINIVLTKQANTNNELRNSKDKNSIGIKIPTKGDGSLANNDINSVNNYIKENQFSLDIVVNGPNISTSELNSRINKILNSETINDKYSEILNILSSLQDKISNGQNAQITQYYYTPFTLYGCENINWDVKKQNKLIDINENLYEVIKEKYDAKSIIQKTSAQIYEEDLETNYKFSPTNKNIVIQNIIPNVIKFFKNNFTVLESEEKKLQNIYDECSNLSCKANDGCCLTSYDNSNFLKFKEYKNQLSENIENQLGKLIIEEQIPSCQKQNFSTIEIQNLSSNPYTLYNYADGKGIKVLNGKENYSLNLKPGIYQFKAVQNSGFLMYPTTNIRKVIINNFCENQIIKIGFND